MAELRIAVIEDDPFRRGHMAQQLDRSPHIAVVHALDQDEAATWPKERWEALDFVIVDVYDEYAPGEVGTDLFSGIVPIERLRNWNVPTLAISPHRHHPLVEHRVYQAGATYLYRSWEISDLDKLVQALLQPAADHRPRPVASRVLKRFGADFAHTNKAIAAYERSPLYGKLYAGLTKRATGLGRRTVDAFTREVEQTGFDGVFHPASFDGTERSPDWRRVRDYLLVLLGRKDAPSTDTDGHPDPAAV